jgi:lysophospholipase L1-like esterase
MWGYGVENEEMFATQLEESLPQTQTVNLGANGYSTVQEVVRFENEGLKYSPEWAVLVFTTNDLGDNFDDKKGGRPVAEISDDGALRIANRPVRRQWKSPVKQWFRHHSKLFGFAEYSSELIEAKRKERRLQREHAKGAKLVSEPTRKSVGDMEFSLFDLYVEPSPETDRAWEAVDSLFERVGEHMEKTGGRVLIVFTANKEAMDREAFSERFSSGESLGLDWDRPAARLAEITAAQEIGFVDLHPAFRQEEDPMTLFLKNNGHWSAAGHELAARTVAEKIRSLEGER